MVRLSAMSVQQTGDADVGHARSPSCHRRSRAGRQRQRLPCRRAFAARGREPAGGQSRSRASGSRQHLQQFLASSTRSPASPRMPSSVFAAPTDSRPLHFPLIIHSSRPAGKPRRLLRRARYHRRSASAGAGTYHSSLDRAASAASSRGSRNHPGPGPAPPPKAVAPAPKPGQAPRAPEVRQAIPPLPHHVRRSQSTIQALMTSMAAARHRSGAIAAFVVLLAVVAIGLWYRSREVRANRRYGTRRSTGPCAAPATTPPPPCRSANHNRGAARPKAAEPPKPQPPVRRSASSRRRGKERADGSRGVSLPQPRRRAGTGAARPLTSPVAAGPLVFYTRVKSARNTKVQHRWYRGNELRRSSDLGIIANPGSGYRTFQPLHCKRCRRMARRVAVTGRRAAAHVSVSPSADDCFLRFLDLCGTRRCRHRDARG